MPGDPQLWEETQLLTPSRDWARRRFGATDLSWVGPSFGEPAEPGRYTRAPGGADGPDRFCGILSAFATAPSLQAAARTAQREGRPSAWEGLDLLFLPLELSIETRDTWWRLGTRPDVASTLLRAFGLRGVVPEDDEDLVERVLAWLPDYVAGRGLGDYARRLLRLLDSQEASRWAHLPGEVAIAPTEKPPPPLEPGGREQEIDALVEEIDGLLSGEIPAVRLSGDPLEDQETVQEPVLDSPDSVDDLPIVRIDPQAPAPQPTGNEAAQALLDGAELLAVRSLPWFEARAGSADLQPGRTLAITGGAVCATGHAPRLRPEDALLHLDAARPVDPAAFRVLPPWTQIRFLPPLPSEAS